MNVSISFIRAFFFIIAVLFTTAYMTTLWGGGFTLTTCLFGIALGSGFAGMLFFIEKLFKNFNLHAFNIALIGLFFGYLMGEALMLIFKSAIDVSTLNLSNESLSFLRLAIFLFTAYLGMVMTARSADELYVSLPFIRFKPSAQKKKDILLDSSVLLDPRIIDLASSGLLDHHLILPRFTLKELQMQAEAGDENGKSKARRALDVIKKLESIPTLDMRYSDADFTDAKDLTTKIARLARHLDANVLTADISKIQQASLEGIRIINIHFLSNALKPITQSGEFITIKIQRYGKEPRQGVGYLDDGTMVVVNGGAEYIGETINAQVLSVKHTSSGRMIFCNATEESMLSEQEIQQSMDAIEKSQKNYFAS